MREDTMKNIVALFLTVFSFASFADAQTCTPAPSGLVSWWAADGNALDLRSRNNGTLEGGANFAAGNVGQGFNFDAPGERVAINNNNSLNVTGDITLEAWINPRTIAGDQRVIIDKRDLNDQNSTYTLFLETNGTLTYRVAINGVVTAFSSTATVPINTFTHVALTIQGSTLTFYRNGTAFPGGTINVSRPATTGRVIIGGIEVSPPITQGSFDGVIDEAAIYNRALSASEIAAIFNSGTAGKCKPTATVPPACLVGWWGGDGNALDISGNGNHGTLQSGAGFAAGKVGQSFNFDGIDDVVSIPHNSNQNINGSFSAEAWIFPETLPNVGPRILDKDDGVINSNRWLMAVANDGTNVNSLAVQFNNTFLDTPNNSIPLNQWSHVAFTYEGASGELKLFINGVQLAVVTVSGQTTSITTPLRIGNDITNTRQFDGLIDEPTIYNCALTQDEITSIFNAGSAGKLKPQLPTAASVTVAGRVLTANNRGVARAQVSMTNADGNALTVLTNGFGYYRFTDVYAGGTYIFKVSHKRYEFAPQARHINEERNDVDFLASNPK